MLNIALIGNTNVGKTALMNFYCRKSPNHKDKRVTIGVELEPVWLSIYGQKIKLKIWDTAG